MVRLVLVLSYIFFTSFLVAEKTVEELRNLLKQGLFVDAINEAKSILKNKPDDPELLIFLVEYYLYFVEDLDAANEYLLKLKKVLPEKSFLDQISYGYRVPFYEHQILLQSNRYEEALQLLNRIESERIFLPSWFYHTKSWNLFKLSRITEAMEAAERGLAVGEDPISNLNMLGILHSVNQNYEESIEKFEKAIELGKFFNMEHLAVINNLAEVYEELFKEQKAISLYEQAIGEDTNCEAFLTYINLAFLYLDFLEVSLSKKTLERYKQCVARFPYKSPKAYLPLFNLVEARIKLIEGDFDAARDLLRTVLDFDQWLGRIGTDVSDMRLSSFQTLYLATRGKIAKDYSLATNLWEKILVSFNNLWLKKELYFINREFFKLAKKLNNFEDLRIRFSDSFLFYPFLGEQLKKLPKKAIKNKITQLYKNSNVAMARVFYDLYLANIGSINRLALKDSFSKLRSWYDEALSVAYLSMLSEVEDDLSTKISYETLMYEKLPVSFYLFNKKLPVELDCSLRFWEKRLALFNSPLYEVPPGYGRFKLTMDKDGETFKFVFSDKKGKLKSIIVRDVKLMRGFKTLVDKVFQ